ncbi:MAG: DUF4400 domain-containing protein [Hydrogenovibrio crunogenus]|nr:DUF4400 domain-containing protein [Hydrogenovibrio crunogenus]
MSDTASQAENKKKGLFFRLLDVIVALIMTYIGSLFLSVIIELLGIFFNWWDMPGALHAKASLVKELQWLNSDFKQIMVAPVEIASFALKLMYEYVIETSHLSVLIEMLKGTVYEQYFMAISYTVQLNAVRLAVIVMSLPAFVLFGVYAVVDGLNERDVRTWSGGRESSFVYHHTKRWIAPFIYLPVIVYLSSPWSIHPSLFMLAFALPFSYAIWLATMYFKKYM